MAQPPPKPLLVFDGECRFCRRQKDRWRRLTIEAVDYQPFQAPGLAERFPEIPRAQYAAAVQLIVPDGTVYSGAEAVFRSLAHAPHRRWLARCYASSPLFACLSERAYRFIARYRLAFSRLARLGGGW